MIRPVIVLALAVAATAAAAADADPKEMLRKLMDIDGYDKLYNIQVSYAGKPTMDALKKYVESNKDDLSPDLSKFRKEVIEKPCKETTQLYEANQSYFDGLPDGGSDFEKNYPSKVKLVVKACKEYLEGDNLKTVHEAVFVKPKKKE